MHMLSWTLSKRNVTRLPRLASSHSWLRESGASSLQRTYTSCTATGRNPCLWSSQPCGLRPASVTHGCLLPEGRGHRGLAWLPRLNLRSSEACHNEPSDGLEEAAKVAILEKAMKARQPTDLMLRCTFYFVCLVLLVHFATRYHIGRHWYGFSTIWSINTCQRDVTS